MEHDLAQVNFEVQRACAKGLPSHVRLQFSSFQYEPKELLQQRFSRAKYAWSSCSSENVLGYLLLRPVFEKNCEREFAYYDLLAERGREEAAVTSRRNERCD